MRKVQEEPVLGKYHLINLLFVNFKMPIVLGGWLSWLECHPLHEKIGISIPHPGTYLEHIREAISLLSVSLNIFPGEDLKRKQTNKKIPTAHQVECQLGSTVCRSGL